MKKIKQILLLGAVILLCFGLGYLCGRQYTMRKENPLQYGVTEQNLRLQSVSWKEYPTYRELMFTIDGEISFRTKPGGCVAFFGPCGAGQNGGNGQNAQFGTIL